MKHIKFSQIFFILYALSPYVMSEEMIEKSENFPIEKLLDRSPSFLRIKGDAVNVMYVIDEKFVGFYVVGVGEGSSSKFTRRFTLKVFENGKIQREVLDENGDEKWVTECESREGKSL